MLHTAVTFLKFLHDVFHPLNGNGYQFWSGIAGSFILGGGIWASLYAQLRRHNCHVHRCWRLSWQPHPEHGHPLCKKHHPHDPRRIRVDNTSEVGHTTSHDGGNW